MQLYDYQHKYLENLPKNAIMSAATGVGKGQMSLEHYKRYSSGLPLLILMPAAKAKTGDWSRELEMAGLGDTPHTIVSYDKFARNPKVYLPSGDFCLIADEVHFCKNATTKRGKALIVTSRLCSQFIGLSATPMGNGYSDATTYAVIFGLSRNKTDFVNRFVIIDRSLTYPRIVGYREQTVLKAWWDTISRPLERVMESKSLGVDIVLSKSRLASYKLLLKERITPEGEMLDSAPKLFAHLRQSVADDRKTELESILDSTTENVVVFYNYNVEREAIYRVLETRDIDIYEQSGHFSKLPDRKDWDTLKQNVTVAQYQSASAAIELQYASIMVFYSPTYSYTDYQQAKGRIRRVGQTKTPLYYCFRVRGTIDDQVWKALGQKRDFDQNVVKSLDN